MTTSRLGTSTVRSTTLPSGLRVFSEAMSSVRSVTVGIWADVGSSAEIPQRRGISHVVEHMLFKGTARRSAREIAEAIDGVGGNMNAFTDKESTCYYARVMDRHLPLALDVLSDMFLGSTFEPEELRKEQRVILEEIRMYDDSPDDLVHDLFTRTMWSGSNLGEPTIGYAETVTALTSDDLRAHMQAHYAPNAAIVAVAGNVDHDDLVARCEEAFRSYAGSAAPPVPETPAAKAAVSVRVKDTEQAYVMIGAGGLSSRDDRRYALAVLDTILGGGMSSRLFQEIRERRGLAYSVYSMQQNYRGAGLFAVYAGTAPASVQECVDVIVAELDALATKGPTQNELQLAKEHLKGSLTLSLESTSSRMIRMGRSELTFGRQFAPEEIESMVDSVTRDDVQSLAKSIFARERLGLCVLGPVDESALRLG